MRLALFFGLALAAPAAHAQPAHGYHTHDGFYFRGSIGVGTLNFNQRSDLDTVPNGTVNGPGSASDLMIGGTPVLGLAVGGALLATHAPNPSFDRNSPAPNPDVPATFVIAGPFVDYFFLPHKGFHLGAAAGPAVIWYKDLDPDSNSDREAYAGVGAAAWAGYDAWISANWSLGGYARAMIAQTKREVDYSGSPLTDEHVTGTSLAVLFTALYH